MYRAIRQGDTWYVIKIPWSARQEMETLKTLVDEGTVVLYADALYLIESAIGKYELVKDNEEL